MRWFLILYLCSLSNSLAAFLDKDESSPLSYALQGQSELDEEVDSSSVLPNLLQMLHLRAKVEGPIDNKSLKKIQVCETCHAAALNRYNHYLPLLRGQNQEYLFAKIYNFKTDERSTHPFPPYLRSLSNKEIMDMSLFYGNQESGLTKDWILTGYRNSGNGANETLADLQSCRTCHGADGKGSQLVPKISGQNENYLSYRIREIANQSSKVHLKSVAAIDCSINIDGIRESRKMASQLALVLDDSSISRGELIYDQNCATCHEQGEKGAPKLGDKLKWQERVSQGWEALIENTIRGKAKMPYRGGNWFLSRNQ